MATRVMTRAPATLPLYARAVAPLLPLASRLPFVAGGGGELPDLELVLEDAAADRGRLAAYAEVCGFTPGDALPATYPHVLAFPLHMALMTDGRFPYGAAGLVHVANRIAQHRPIGAGEQLTLSVRAADAGPHPRGRAFTLLSQARAGGELVWEDASTMLRRGGGGEGSGPRDRDPDRGAGDAPLEPGAQWHLRADLGRRYAAVSGDRNPIHLSAPTAKLLGFPRAIAHGMWTKARCLAALEGRLPEAFTVDVAFRRPILLPGRVAFASSAGDGAIRFAVRDPAGAHTHLEGTVAP
jgi:acyl dehydratase